MRLKSLWPVAQPRLVRFFDFRGGDVGNGKTVEASLDGNLELVDLLAYAVQRGASSTDEVPILVNDQIHFRTVGEGWREWLACAEPIRVRGVNNGPDITIPLFKCIDKAKITSFGHAEFVEEVAVLRITHESKRPDANDFSGAMLVNKTHRKLISNLLTLLIEILPSEVLKCGESGNKNIKRRYGMPMTLHPALLFFLTLGQKIRRIRTKRCAEECCEKAADSFDDESASSHINSLANV